MAAAGFTMVYIGIESGNERDLEIYNKRASIEDNHNAISLLANMESMYLWDLLCLTHIQLGKYYFK